MSRAVRRFLALLTCLAVTAGALAAGSVANAHEEVDHVHTSTGLVSNGGFESGGSTAATGWTAWGSGYTISTAEAHSGDRSLGCELSGTGQCGAYQGIALNRSNALPLKVSAWSKAAAVSGTASTDYSIWVDLTFSDDTTQYGEAEAINVGTHDWQKTSFYIDPPKPVKSLLVYVLFRDKSGAVLFDDVDVEEIPADLLPGGTFDATSGGQVSGWGSWGSGYVAAAGEGRGGTTAVKATATAAAQEYGIWKTATLNQTTPGALLVRGWSRSDGVSGEPGRSYSLYADLVYTDDTSEYGLNVQFDRGTHDWQLRQLEIVPTKPIKSVTIYALFRGGTGTVWFDNVSLEQLPASTDGGPVLGKVNPATTTANLLTNPSFQDLSGALASGWGTLGDGYSTEADGGWDGGRAVKMTNASASSAAGIYQVLQLNQTTPKQIVFSGRSRASGVTGSIDSGYALYMDVFYTDGTADYAITKSFATGTHGWAEQVLTFQPQKTVQTLSVYGLFRNGHQGSVWFDDFAVRQLSTEAGTFEEAMVRPLPYSPGATDATISSGDGLALGLGPRGISSVKWDGTELGSTTTPSGFLARDVQSDSDVFGFIGSTDSAGEFSGRAEALDLKVDAKYTAADGGIRVSGSVTDLRGTDRAVTVTYAIPIDAAGWRWSDYLRSDRAIATGEAGYVYRNAAAPDFETGPMSIYPNAAIFDPATGAGLSLGVDYGKPTHYRLEYNGSTEQLTISFEIGLSQESKDPSAADFGFVVYGFDGANGARASLEKYMALFPENYEVRVPDQGIWMPFAPISEIPDHADFGFRFKEGDDDPAEIAFDDANDILTFHYSELGTWWQSIDTSLPQTVATATSARDVAAANGDESAQMSQSAASLNSNGEPYLTWLSVPWNTGARWEINTNPDLPGSSNGYRRYFSQDKLDARYNTSGHQLDGEYLDTLDGFPNTLDYDRAHFAYASTPLAFSNVTKRPAVNRAFSTWEATARLAGELRDHDRFLMANGTPHVYSMYTPWLDAMGIERNWLGAGGAFVPDSDETLMKYRTLSGAKPFLMLQNTDFSQFDNADMEAYMQRTLFYGIYPSAFSATADDATNYWKNSTFYERDRALFVKYIPLVREVAEAGWEPLTHATADAPGILMERYGHGPEVFLTVMNPTTAAVTGAVSFDRSAVGLGASISATETVSNAPVALSGESFSVSLDPQEVKVFKLTSQ